MRALTGIAWSIFQKAPMVEAVVSLNKYLGGEGVFKNER